LFHCCTHYLSLSPSLSLIFSLPSSCLPATVGLPMAQILQEWRFGPPHQLKNHGLQRKCKIGKWKKVVINTWYDHVTS
jgi:hypothetical protein